MKLLVRSAPSDGVVAESRELQRRLEEFAAQEHQSQIRNRSLLWHEELEAGNSPIERLDLKIRHSQAARATDRTMHKERRHLEHTDLMKAVQEITCIVADQPTYAFSRSNDPEYNRLRYDRRIPQWQTAAKNTPLHIAAAKAQFLTLEMIIKRGEAAEAASASSLDESNGDGDTALHLAVETGNVGVIETLLSAGVSILVKNIRGDTPLMRAIKVRQKESVESILNKGKHVSEAVNVCNKDNLSPLLMAAHGGDVDSFRRLVEKGANATVKDAEGNGVLHVAASEGRVAVVIEILKTKLGSVKAVNNAGWTALHFAAANGHVDVIDALVSAGAEVNPVTPGTKETPCQVAFRHKHFVAFEKLIGLGGEGSWALSTTGGAITKDNIKVEGRFLSEKELKDVIHADRARFDKKNSVKEGIQTLRVWPALIGVTPELLYKKKY